MEQELKNMKGPIETPKDFNDTTNKLDKLVDNFDPFKKSREQAKNG